VSPATSEYVAVSPASGSVVLSVPTVVPTAEFSATELFDSVMSVGARLLLPVASVELAVIVVVLFVSPTFPGQYSAIML
jgi:hypothetical protein